MLVVLAGVKVERDSTITAEQRLLVRAGVVAARDRALSAEAQEQQRERSHPSELRTEPLSVAGACPAAGGLGGAGDKQG